MAKAYFIGGAPRTGKTSATLKLLGQHPMLATSTDAIRYILRSTLDKNTHADLFAISSSGFDSQENVLLMRDNPQSIVEIQNRESKAVWKSCVDFIKSNLEDGQDIILEGVAILRECLTKLNIDYKAVFLVIKGDNTEAVVDHARNNTHDWLHKYSDEFIRTFCNYNAYQNEYYRSEAAKYGFTVIEISAETFAEDIEHAASYLIKI